MDKEEEDKRGRTIHVLTNIQQTHSKTELTFVFQTLVFDDEGKLVEVRSSPPKTFQVAGMAGPAEKAARARPGRSAGTG
jgi:hypothetical protein